MSGVERFGLGYGFALPRMVARTAGRPVRRAQFSAVESYGVCLLVFAIHCIFLAQLLSVQLKAISWLRILVLLLLPLLTWIYFLLLYYVISLVLQLLRKFRLFVSWPNNRFQSLVLIALTAFIALRFLRSNTSWLILLGWFWLGLLLLNLLALAAEKVLDAK